MRINKYLATCGICSRRKAEELVLDGKVSVNDIVIKNLATDILDSDRVKVDGKLVKIVEQFEYYMLNKPKGYVSTASDDRERKSVVSLIKTSARIYPVGRLDYDSEGLLLLTNDGELTYKLTHPKLQIGKTYIAKIEGKIDNLDLDKLRNGVTIDGYKLHKCLISNVSFADNTTKMEITIFEGRNRQIRKMFDTIDRKIVFLKRIKIAELKLGGLNRGEYRPLTKKEIEYLKSLSE